MTGHQVYVTHCTRADSVTNTVGFGVRATSSDDPAVLKATDYPAYELPLDLWDKQPTRAEAPRRLARVRTDGGQVLVVHSAYLEADTLGRGRSYFTHALLLPEADPADVLRSWGAEAWVTDYVAGATKELPTTELPKGMHVRARAIKAFLTGQCRRHTLCADVGTQSVPSTLGSERRDLLERFVYGVYLATLAGDRLIVHAEPGLVALLLYAAVRSLPRVLVGDLTFTTYEPAHRGLKDFTAALVVGTYLANLERNLGYVLDTFDAERSSPELRGPAPKAIGALVQFAEWNRWAKPDLLDAIVRKPPTLTTLDEVAGLLGAWQRIHDGTATGDDLTQLVNDPRVPASAKGAALAIARGADPLAGVALELLFVAPADVLAAYARTAWDGDPVAMIDAVFHPEADHTAPVLQRLLERPSALSPDQWHALAARYRLFDDARLPVLLADERLARFLRALADQATPHWSRLADRLDARGLLTGDPLQTTIRDQLVRAWTTLEADKLDPKAIVPEAVWRKLLAATVLRHAVAGEPSRYTRPQLLAALRVFDVSELTALETLYHAWIGSAHPGHRPELFRRFTGLFDLCFPPDAGHVEPARQWLALSVGCPDEAQEWFQLDFLMRAVPADERATLVRDHGLPFLPEVVAAFDRGVVRSRGLTL